MCCGTLHKILQYKIQNGSLVQVEDPAPTTDVNVPSNENFNPNPYSQPQSGAPITETPSPTPSTSSSSDGWIVWGLFVLVTFGGSVWAKRNKNKKSNTNGHNYSNQQQSNTNYNHNKTKERRPQDDPEMKSMYRKVIHKYHPDHARSDEDKKFRNDLTAKLNKAYQEGDIETIRLFQ